MTAGPRSVGADAEALDRPRVVAASMSLIDRVGLHGLSMPKVAEALGVPVADVHRVFRTREALLDAIVDSMIDELYADPEVHPETADWQEYLQRVAHGVRRTAMAHPQVFPLVASRPPAAPWLQPPLRSLRWMEAFLETLHRCGFSNRRAVAAYRAFSSFLLGHLLLEVSAMGADISPVEEADLRPRQPGDLADYPRLASMQTELTDSDPDDEFEEALESLLDRLEGQGIR